ncbi:hypothetical protein AOLI_G00262260 [Acnodon oligacanthus]
MPAVLEYQRLQSELSAENPTQALRRQQKCLRASQQKGRLTGPVRSRLQGGGSAGGHRLGCGNPTPFRGADTANSRPPALVSAARLARHLSLTGRVLLMGSDSDSVPQPSVDHLLMKTRPSPARTRGPFQTENHGSVSRSETNPGLQRVSQRRSASSARSSSVQVSCRCLESPVSVRRSGALRITLKELALRGSQKRPCKSQKHSDGVRVKSSQTDYRTRSSLTASCRPSGSFSTRSLPRLWSTGWTKPPAGEMRAHRSPVTVITNPTRFPSPAPFATTGKELSIAGTAEK